MEVFPDQHMARLHFDIDLDVIGPVGKRLKRVERDGQSPVLQP